MRQSVNEQQEAAFIRKQQATIVLPIAPLEVSQIPTKQNIAKALNNEYCSKYLQSIGAEPTRLNLELVKRYLPLESDLIHPKLKSEGFLKDEIELTIPQVAHDCTPLPIASPRELLILGLVKEIDLVNNNNDDDNQNPQKLKENTATSNNNTKYFMDIMQKYLYPYYLDKNLSKSKEYVLSNQKLKLTRKQSGYFKRNKCTVSLKRGGSIAEQMMGEKGGSFDQCRAIPLVSSFGYGRRVDPSEEEILTHELQNELSQKFEPSGEVIFLLLSEFESGLTEWFISQAEETFREHINNADFLDAMETLSSNQMLSVATTLILFMYEEFVVRSSLINTFAEIDMYRDHQHQYDMANQANPYHPPFIEKANDSRIQDNQQIRLFGIYTELNKLVEECRKHSAGQFFKLPILILALRVSLERIFRLCFPLWTKSQQGHQALAEMDKLGLVQL